MDDRNLIKGIKNKDEKYLIEKIYEEYEGRKVE